MTKTRLNLRRVGKVTLLTSLAVLISLVIIDKSYALNAANELPAPISGQISGATLTNPDVNTLKVTVTQPVAKINYTTYNIGTSNNVIYNFTAPNQSAFNRVTSVGGSANASYIYGKITQEGYAGNVYLINPNGILFGKNSVINVGSFMASTLDVTDSEISSFITNKKLTFARGVNATPGVNITPGAVILQNGASFNVTNGILLANGIKDYNSASPVNVKFITSDGVTFKVQKDNFVQNSAVIAYTRYEGDATKTGKFINHPGIPIANMDLEIIPDDPTPEPTPVPEIKPDVPTHNISLLPGRELDIKLIAPTPLKLTLDTENHNHTGTNIAVSPIGNTTVAKNADKTVPVPGLIALNNSTAPHIRNYNETTVALSELTPLGAAGKIHTVGNVTPKETFDMIIDQSILPDQE